MKQLAVIEEVDIYRFRIALERRKHFCKMFKEIYKKYSISGNVFMNDQTCVFDRNFAAEGEFIINGIKEF